MRKIKVEIKNGYGIHSLNEFFDFNVSQAKPSNSVVSVYAQNGTMKSSFAKTMRDHADVDGKPIFDHIFIDKKGECKVFSDGKPVSKENILAIPSFDTGAFKATDMSSLVASEKIKKEYDDLVSKYDIAWSKLITKIKNVAKPKSTWKEADIINEILSSYGIETPSEPRLLINLFENPGMRKDISDSPDFIKEIPYTKLDTAQVKNFIKNNSGTISKLIAVYEEIRKSPSYYKNGFDVSNARIFADAVESSKYFDADHSLTLSNAQTKDSVSVVSVDELEEALSTDIELILSKKPALRKPFEQMIKDFGKSNHSDLRRILENKKTNGIVLLMDNQKDFKRKIWQGYLKECQQEADELISEKNAIEVKLKKLAQDARDEKTEWDRVANQFNERFLNLPYKIRIDNKDSLIFQDTKIPTIILRYSHPSEKGKFVDFGQDDSGQLGGINNLSTGERKAFYVLNILFELEVRQKSGQDHLVVLDDIVDSFDYKNKYAFLEYICDIASNFEHIRLILLTHNFDFFRLLKSRLQPSDKENFRIAINQQGKITLETAEYFEIFKFMRQNAKDERKIWLSTIPFVRNLCEFVDDPDDDGSDCMKLTRALHSLDDDQDMSIVQGIINKHLSTVTNHPFGAKNDNQLFYEVLIDEARGIKDDGTFNLYDNIVLALACRRMAEDYMKYKINDQQLIDRKKKEKVPFTRVLYRIYDANHSLDTAQNREKMAQVNLFTPEHIHLNAFAYEPLIDIDKRRLVKLRDEVDALYKTI